jgi:sugar-specific transcriptional regulator TrmB
MTNDTETIKKIRLFGLNTYEAKIWAALLSRGTSTAGELSDIANVPRSRSYDVLETLEKKGFVSAKTTKPIKYVAAPPKEVLDNVKNKIREDREEHLHTINTQSFNNLINYFQEVYEKNTESKESTIAILKDRKNIYKHLNFLLKNSKDAILSSIDPKQDRYFEITLNKTQPNTKKTDVRLCLVDDNLLLFPLQEKETHPDYDLCVWVKNKKTTKFLRDILSNS